MKKFLILPLLLLTLASVAHAQWTEPTLTPPSGNVLAPLRLDSNGRLGIGTASPAYPLDVVGNIRSTGSILSSTFGTNTGDLNITGSGWGMIFNIDTDANSTNNYIFRGDNAEIMRLTDTGRLGIGVTSPATPLQVSGTISSMTGNFTNSELNDYLLLDPADDSFRFFSNNNQRFTVLASGNVGIGNAAPAYALDVAGDINATGCVRVDGTCLTTSGGTIDGTGTANTLSMFTAATTLGNSNISELADGSVRVTTSGGYADFGPKNASWNHIYTDRPNTIFNTSIYSTSGGFSSYTPANLSLQTNGTTRMTILNSNGNVGIGTVTPAHRLDVAGDVNVTGCFRVAGTCLVAGGGTIGGSGTTNYVPKFTSASNIGNSQIFDNGTNVGIGTASPSQRLTVNGTTLTNRLMVVGGGYGLINANVGTDNTAGLSLHYPGLTAWQLGRRGSSLSFATTGGASSDTMGTDRLTITSTGNVGIGTTAPASRLQVNTPTIGGGELRVVASDTEAGLGLYTSGHSWVAGVGAWGNNDDFTIANNTAGTEGVKFLIQPNGNVGVGTSNPTAKLHIVDTYNELLFGSGLGGIWINNTSQTELYSRYLANSIIVNGYSGNKFAYNEGGGSGSVTVTNGTNTTTVAPTGITTGTISAQQSSGSGSPSIFAVNYSASAPAIQAAAHSASGYGIYAGNSVGTGYGIWCQSGRCGGNQAWTNASDERLKKNISTITNGLDKVLKLRGVNFQWKEGDTEAHNIGFIAQEVLEVVPEVVKQNADGYYTLSEGSMSAVLVEAIKELKAENDDLKARLEKLEAKLR